jgi:lipoprotein signal peptidase
MIAYLNRYYAFGLIVTLLAPLWLLTMTSEATSASASLRDALIWSTVLCGCWLLITKRRGFGVRGSWRGPTKEETNLYFRLLIGVLLLDFGSKAIFFRWDRPDKVEVFKNFGLHSVFHVTAFESFHLMLFLYFFYVFLLGALFFRFSIKLLDRLWLVSCAFALGGAIALFSERLMFGGVHNSFFFAGPLMWICPPCASPRFASYAWTPADLFVHAALMPLIILLVSYLVPLRATGRGSD